MCKWRVHLEKGHVSLHFATGWVSIQLWWVMEGQQWAKFPRLLITICRCEYGWVEAYEGRSIGGVRDKSAPTDRVLCNLGKFKGKGHLWEITFLFCLLI